MKWMVPFALMTLLVGCSGQQTPTPSELQDSSDKRNLTVRGTITFYGEVTAGDRELCLVKVADGEAEYGVIDGRGYSCGWRFEVGEAFAATTQKLRDWQLNRDLKALDSKPFYVSLGPDSADARIREVATSPELDQAIADNYEYGRDLADFGGIGLAKKFALGKMVKASKEAIVEQMILATANPVTLSFEWGFEDLYNFCSFDIATPVVKECASKLVADHSADSGALAAFVENLSLNEPATPEQEKFNADLQKIVSMVMAAEGEREVVAMTGSGLNVELLYFVYINRTSGEAYFILGDWGA